METSEFKGTGEELQIGAGFDDQTKGPAGKA